MKTAADRPLSPLPEKLEILHDRESITIRRTWFSAATFFLLIFSLFWNGFLVAWMTIALTSGNGTMALFALAHAAVGIGVAYFTLASFLNRTDVSINPMFLTVRHHPLPWFGQRQLRVAEVEQLYTKEQISRHKNRTTITYEVHALLQGNRQQKLLSGLTDVEQARYIERELETILGLKDVKVAGELRQ